MPPTGRPNMVQMSVRISREVRDEIDGLAHDANLSAARVIELLLAYALGRSDSALDIGRALRQRRRERS